MPHGQEPGCWGTSRAHGELKSPCTAVWRCAYRWPPPCFSTTALQDLGMQLLAPPSSSLFFSGSACFGSRLSVGRLGLFLSVFGLGFGSGGGFFFGWACFGSRWSVGRLGLFLSVFGLGLGSGGSSFVVGRHTSFRCSATETGWSCQVLEYLVDVKQIYIYIVILFVIGCRVALVASRLLSLYFVAFVLLSCC